MLEALRKGDTTAGSGPVVSRSGAAADRAGKSDSRNSKWAARLSAALIVLATVATYSNSFSGVFVFDDRKAILENESLRQLWPLSQPLSPPNDGSPVGSRPLLNLSLAINYAINEDDVWGYHAANLTIHLATALLLLGTLLRTFDLPSLRERWGQNRVALAWGIALLWAIHPLQTESVIYISQRAESLVGLFYFLTLYCFVRGESSARAGFWRAAAFAACLLGMASKEVMASAPLIVLLFDRTFCAGSFREAWRRHQGLYLCLAATWGLLGWLVISGGGRAGTVGLGLGIGMSSYLLSQCWTIIHYVLLCIWPDPLVLDYGTAIMTRPWDVMPAAVMVVILGFATIVALWRRPQIGFLGACFFMILAPTSSVIPVVTQPIAEHRMYLPLAAVLATLVIAASAAHRWLVGRWLIRQKGSFRWIPRVISSGGLSLVAGCAVVGFGFGVLTFQRNQDYQSDIAIWEDTVAKAPSNGRAHNELGVALEKLGRTDEAIAAYLKSVELDPNSVHARANLGNLLAKRGRADDAVDQLHQALRIKPHAADLLCGLGGILVDAGRVDEGLVSLRKSLAIRPDSAEARNNLGNALARQGRFEPAITEFRKALDIKPAFASAHNNLGLALVKSGRLEDSVKHFQKAVELDAAYTQAQLNLGAALKATGRPAEAISSYREAIANNPNNADFHHSLAIVLTQQGQLDDAIAEYRKALKIKPNFAEAQNNLGYACFCQGRLDEAIVCYKKALRIQPRHAGAQNNLGAALGQKGRLNEAIVHFRASLRIQPDFASARNNLASALRQIEETRDR